MIVLEIQTNQQSYSKNILVIDAHSHLGRDEDGLQNMNPMAPDGTFNFYSGIKNALRKSLGDNYNFEITINNLSYHFSFEFKPVLVLRNTIIMYFS